MNIPKEAEPDINIPQIYVNTTHEGISPEDAERARELLVTAAAGFEAAGVELHAAVSRRRRGQSDDPRFEELTIQPQGQPRQTALRAARSQFGG